MQRQINSANRKLSEQAGRTFSELYDPVQALEELAINVKTSQQEISNSLIAAKYDSVSSNNNVDTKTMTNADCPFIVRVSISDLNIRKGAGTNTAKTGKYTGIGSFTIVQVKSGKGSTAGWGKLKSGAGWISLDYAARI